MTLNLIDPPLRPSGSGAPAGRPASSLPLPALVNPSQAVDGFGCQTGNSSSTTTSSFAQTPMSMAAMLDYYGAQLRDSGWTAVPAPATVLGRTWTRRDSSGVLEAATVTITEAAEDSTCRTLRLDVRRSR